jgi:hypothetical protein
MLNFSLPTVLGGVSQKPPYLRRPGQHADQINMFCDPVRGLGRRHGSKVLDFKQGMLGGIVSEAEAASFRDYPLSVGASDYVVVTRYRAKVPLSAVPPFIVANRETGELLNVNKPPSDSVLTAIENNGVAAATAVGRFIVMAPKGLAPTYTRTATWAVEANQRHHAVWVRGGAYSRPFSITLIRGNQKFTVTYTTRQASYPGVLDTSDLLPSDPEYTKKVNDRTNQFNSWATRWAGEALADATPENIAQRLRDMLVTSGFLSPGSTVTVRDSTIVIDDPSVEEIEVSDGGDNSLIRGTGNTVSSPEALTTVALPGKVVKVRPTNDAGGVTFYVKAIAKDKSTGAPAQVTWEETAGSRIDINRLFAVGTVHNGQFYISSDLGWLKNATGLSIPNYVPSDCGDEDSVPTPAFLDAGVTGLGVFQDRLIIGTSGGTLATSRTGDYFNLFPGSVVTSVASDPVGFQILGGEDDALRSMAVYDRSLMINGDKRQYVIPGRQALTPATASASVLASISGAGGVPAVVSGNFMFLLKDSAGSAALYQVRPGLVENSPFLLELSSELDSYLKGKAVSLAVGDTPDVVVIRTDGSQDLFLYQFMDRDGDRGPQRVMEAWHRWNIAGFPITQILSASIRDGKLLLVAVVFAGGEKNLVCTLSIPLTADVSDLPYLDFLHQSTTFVSAPGEGAGDKRMQARAAGRAAGYKGVTRLADLETPGRVPEATWHGFIYTSEVALTSPQVPADGPSQLATETVVSTATVQLASAGGVAYDLVSNNGESFFRTFRGSKVQPLLDPTGVKCETYANIGFMGGGGTPGNPGRGVAFLILLGTDLSLPFRSMWMGVGAPYGLIPPSPVSGTNVVTRTLSGDEPIPKVLALSQLVDATAARPETRLTHNAHSWDYQLNPNDIRVAEWGDMRGTAFTVVGGTKMGWFDFRTLAAEGPGAYRAMTLAAEPDTPNGVIRAAMIGLGVTGLPVGIWGITGPSPDFMPNDGTALAGFTEMINTFGGTGYNWVSSTVKIRGPEGPGGVVNDEEVDVLFIHRQSSPPMLFVMIGTLDYISNTES